MLQPLFDDEPRLRVSKGILTALAIAFLVAGFSFSIVVFVSCDQWKERADIICMYGAPHQYKLR